MNGPMIDKAGLYDDISEDRYHADPVAAISLSSSVCKALVSESPLHAWAMHPRLNKALLERDEEPTKAQDIGTASHKLILGKGRDLKELPFDDYRKDVAKKAKAEARAAGLVPILSDDMTRVRLLYEAFHDQLPGTELADVFNKGTAEVTGVWQDLEDVWCRIRIDWLPDSARAGGHIKIVDVKTTGASAAPGDFDRTAYDMGYDISDAMYQRGVKELIPGVRSVENFFAVIEQHEPHGLSIHRFGGHAFAEAEMLVDLGMSVWSDCMGRNKWPGYAVDTNIIDPARWRSERALMRKMSLQRYHERLQRPLGELEKAAERAEKP